MYEDKSVRATTAQDRVCLFGVDYIGSALWIIGVMRAHFASTCFLSACRVTMTYQLLA
jgi:hypothetical protein